MKALIMKTSLMVIFLFFLSLYITKGYVHNISFYFLDPAMSTDALDLHATMEHKLNLRV